ncbi:MAG: hypothetical protein Q9218_002731 [Villophora microphyllina]
MPDRGTATVTVTVTSPAAAVKRDVDPATTIIAGSPVTILGPEATSVVLNRRMVEARATPAPVPTCLPQYSASPARLTSACNCLSITSSTASTISTAPTSTTPATPLFDSGGPNKKQYKPTGEILSKTN